MRHVERGGRYYRVADRGWSDSLSAEHSRRRGGRWNPPGGFGVVYLNDSRELARAQLRHKLEPRGIRPEDLEPSEGPVLVEAEVPSDRYVDAIGDAGLRSLRLPATYPRDGRGRPVAHSRCQPIGQRAWDADEPGIACRSAASAAPAGSEELAHFDRAPLVQVAVERFTDWYW